MIKFFIAIAILCGAFYMYLSYLDQEAVTRATDPIVDVYGG